MVPLRDFVIEIERYFRLAERISRGSSSYHLLLSRLPYKADFYCKWTYALEAVVVFLPHCLCQSSYLKNDSSIMKI